MVKNPKFAQVLHDASKTDTRVGFSKNILPFCTLIVAEHGRSKKKYYKLAIMGRTGKKNPRLGEDFLIWADAENIISPEELNQRIWIMSM